MGFLILLAQIIPADEFTVFVRWARYAYENRTSPEQFKQMS